MTHPASIAPARSESAAEAMLALHLKASGHVRYLYSIAEEHPGEECSRRSMEDAAWRIQ